MNTFNKENFKEIENSDTFNKNFGSKIKFSNIEWPTVKTKDLKFDSCMFDNVNFIHTQLINSTFTNCKFKAVKFENVIWEDISFENCSFDDGVFSNFRDVKNNSFTNVEFIGTKFNRGDGPANQSGMKNSSFKSVLFDNVYIDDFRFKKSSFEKLLIKNSVLKNMHLGKNTFNNPVFKDNKYENIKVWGGELINPKIEEFTILELSLNENIRLNFVTISGIDTIIASSYDNDGFDVGGNTIINDVYYDASNLKGSLYPPQGNNITIENYDYYQDLGEYKNLILGMDHSDSKFINIKTFEVYFAENKKFINNIFENITTKKWIFDGLSKEEIVYQGNTHKNIVVESQLILRNVTFKDVNWDGFEVKPGAEIIVENVTWDVKPPFLK